MLPLLWVADSGKGSRVSEGGGESSNNNVSLTKWRSKCHGCFSTLTRRQPKLCSVLALSTVEVEVEVEGTQLCLAPSAPSPFHCLALTVAAAGCGCFVVIASTRATFMSICSCKTYSTNSTRGNNRMPTVGNELATLPRSRAGWGERGKGAWSTANANKNNNNCNNQLCSAEIAVFLKAWLAWRVIEGVMKWEKESRIEWLPVMIEQLYPFHISFIYNPYIFNIHFISFPYPFHIHFISLPYAFHIHSTSSPYPFHIHFISITYLLHIHSTFISDLFSLILRSS